MTHASPLFSLAVAAALAPVAFAPLAVAPAAQAQGLPATDRIVQELITTGQLSTMDKVWLTLSTEERTEDDQAVCDAFAASLAARGIAVAWDVGLARSVATGGYREQLAALQAMGVTRILSFGSADDRGNLSLRVVQVPGGWLSSVRQVDLTAAKPPAPSAREARLERLAPVPFDWNPQHGLGIQYSSLSGSGATYRRWLPSGWGVQIAGIPALSLTNNQTQGFVNLGLQGMAPLLKTDSLRLYTLLGIGALYQPHVVRYSYDYDTQLGSSRTADAWDIGLAPGIGLDFRVHERILLTGALGYTFSRSTFGGDPARYGYSPGITLGSVVEW